MHIIDAHQQALIEEASALDAFMKGNGEAPVVYRSAGYVKASGEVADGEGPITFIASEESSDRMGDVITVDGWDLKNFKRNPVVLFGHQMRSLPIGKVTRVWKDTKQLLATTLFDSSDEFASQVEGKIRRGFLNAVSVGFRPLEMEEIKDSNSDSFFPGFWFLSQELLELSVVSVPAHPKALRKMYGDDLPNKFYLFDAHGKPDIQRSITASPYSLDDTLTTDTVRVPTSSPTASDFKDYVMPEPVQAPLPFPEPETEPESEPKDNTDATLKDLSDALDAALSA